MISIITPVFNSEKYIGQCIDSVLNQTYANWEQILVDDCSADNSIEIIQEYAQKDQRIKYHRLEKNSGAGVARNKAIELANGRFIAFLDADDYWAKDKLHVQIDTMIETGTPLSYTSYYVVDENSSLKFQRKVPLK